VCELSATLIHHLITVVPCCSLWIRSISFQLILATSPVWVLSFDLQHLLFPWIKKARDSYHIISEILAHCQVYKFVSFRDIISFQLDWKMLTISNSVFEWLIGWQMWEQKLAMRLSEKFSFWKMQILAFSSNLLCQINYEIVSFAGHLLFQIRNCFQITICW